MVQASAPDSLVLARLIMSLGFGIAGLVIGTQNLRDVRRIGVIYLFLAGVVASLLTSEFPSGHKYGVENTELFVEFMILPIVGFGLGRLI